ncbi:antitrypsin-like [Formica exsecta]|uniref:antitrypsin-like n=1 Tax=Formica exsecta TaxID=72781 RepID=UPI001144A147|nr:antitrypsin-like [Formica exsecta]
MVTMRTALFAIIIVNIVCAFDPFEDFEHISSDSEIFKNRFANLSTAIVTYVELKDIFSFKEPSYINQSIEKMKNQLFSPTSIDMVASLLLNGAKGSTENELMSFFNNYNKIPLSNRYLPEVSYLDNLRNIALHLETAVYVQNSIELTADFSSICISKFNCSISKIDFRNNIYAAETINSWVQETTNNKILDVISPVNIDGDTKIMLVNIVYLNSRWPDSIQREERIFHFSQVERHFVSTIKFKNSTFIYGEIPHWHIKFIEVPFLDDNVTMTILLPTEGMKPGWIEKNFVYEEYQSIRTAYINKKQDMELYLPKFRTEMTRNLTDFFRERDVITMFEDNADFTHLSKTPLKVNNIVQKISLKVKKGSLPTFRRIEKRNLPHELIVNYPFIYEIEVNGQLVFSGFVARPDFVRYPNLIRDEL